MFNELIAYSDLGAAKAERMLIDRSAVIASFALCGFANISSIGIESAASAHSPPSGGTTWRGSSVRDVFAGTMANYLSACIAGILLMKR